MSEEISQYEIGGHKVNILDQVVDYSFGELFKIIRATLQFERYDGQMSKPMTRINFERADSVGILLYDPDRDEVVLTEQFRYPVYASLDPDEATGVGAKKAWLLEIVAGVQDAGKTVIEVAQKELFEEAGYRIETDGSWHLIAKIYPSPGGSSERIYLYWARVNREDRTSEGGGIAEEREDIRVLSLSFKEALGMVERGEIQDAKTIIALQYLAIQKIKGSKSIG